MTAPVNTHPAHHHHHQIHGTTKAQRVFVLAVTVSVIAATAFALLSLGALPALTVAGIVGSSTFITLSEFIRVRMVKISQLPSYKHSEWALAPTGFFAHANMIKRGKLKQKQHHIETSTR